MSTTEPSTTRFDVYQTVTESIIAAIEAGASEFVMPWHGSGVAIAKPHNASTRMEYHGINVLALWVEAHRRGYRSGHWASYRQWQGVGAQVNTGEQGSTIVFFKALDKKEEDDGRRLVARASRVFNADQVSGWEPLVDRALGQPADRIEAVESFVTGTAADVREHGSIACYHIRDDYIEMPDRRRFVGTATIPPSEAYAATLLHELVHWTGAKKRLDRGFDTPLRKSALAEEELVAELGAAFLCADLGVSNAPRPDHAAYVANWLQALRNDKRAIFRASRVANQAVAYLHELNTTAN